MSKALCTPISAAVLSLLLASAAQAAGSTKDIVLDRVLAPVATTATATTQAQDAMAVSVLLESPDGTLTPKGTNTLFHTGDRFRIKVIASRDAKLSIYNTTPRGELKPEPVWQGTVVYGQETITPRLAINSDSGTGTEQLHFVLEPAAAPQGVLAWLSNWFDSIKPGANKSAATKDIRLDVQNTPMATYTLNPNGQGLVNSIRIAHR
jgi:hypothetical protein